MKRDVNPRRCRCAGGGRRAVGRASASAGAQTKVSFRVEGAQQDPVGGQDRRRPDRRLDHQGRRAQGRLPGELRRRRAQRRHRRQLERHATRAGSGSRSARSSVRAPSTARGGYWEFFVNNHAASVGICDQKVKSGASAAVRLGAGQGRAGVPDRDQRARQGDRRHGRSRVKASYYPTKSNTAKPLAGVSFTGVKGTTNAQGVATVTATRAGNLSLVGSKPGEIRSAAANDRRLQVTLARVPLGPNRRRRRRHLARLRGLWVRARGRRQGRRRPRHRGLRVPEAR